MKFSINTKRLAHALGIASILMASTAAFSEEADSLSAAVQTCPQSFHAMPLFPNAKMCQIFGEELPASMTYHAATDQQSTQSFYTKELGEADNVQLLKGRIQMEYDNANKIIMISQDGAGTQIDVLVKSS